MSASIDLGPILRDYADQLLTHHLVFEQDLLRRTGPLLRGWLPAGRWVLVADPVTWAVAGRVVYTSLQEAGAQVQRYTVEPAAGQAAPVADDAGVDALVARLRGEGASVAVAVGAGTVNDIVKTAADRLGLPYAAVATAPSMNGYTSALSALLSGGVKITTPCRPPVACLIDLDVVARAPYRMIASGLGDLMSKPVSNADWRLAYRLVGAEYATGAMPLIEAGSRLLDGVGPRLPARDVEAVGRLAASLCVSGIAMSLAGTTAPSSGGEHLISHYLDMTHFAWGEPHDFHGCQVGVATLATAALYERLAALSPEQIDVATLVAAHPPWEEREKQVRQRFGVLSAAVLPHARQGHPTRPELARRLHRLQAEWDAVLAEVGQTLLPAAELAAQLRQAGCPATFAEIGVTPERARRAVLDSRDIRSRYTILHLGADLGLLETWTDAVLAACPAAS
ncbi:MAG: iron-containing alcohol dehydrogenase [Candidatus Latescibacterota bacterium]